jgi:protein-S-isoprenylcysteine O-methyltransferase Ste14
MAVETREPKYEKVDPERRGDWHAARQVGALIGGPLAVLLSQQAKYLLVIPACPSGRLAPLHMAAVLGLLLTLACGLLALYEWRRSGGGWPDHGGGRAGRSRFMGVLAMLMAGCSALVIFAQWIPDWIVSPCQQ